MLHGDLHHDNILQNGDGWLVIDPKGVIGSPINEIWAFIIDIERDVPFIARYFDFKMQDVLDWYFIHIVLAICWNLEDNVNSDLFLNLLQKLINMYLNYTRKYKNSSKLQTESITDKETST